MKTKIGKNELKLASLAKTNTYKNLKQKRNKN